MLYTLLNLVPTTQCSNALRQLATTWTNQHCYGAQGLNARELMVEILALHMLQHSPSTTNMVLLYGWAEGVGPGGLDLYRFLTSFLAAYFTQVSLALQGLVLPDFLHWPVHSYFLALSILDQVESWLLVRQ